MRKGSKKTKKGRSLKSSADQGGTERTKISTESLPRRTLEQAVQIAIVLHHNTYAGKSATWDDIANHLKIGPKSPNTKYLIWAAEAYGLVTRAANDLTLTETGRKIVAPTYEREDVEARVKALLTPALLSKFYADYNGHPIPADEHFPNVLESKYNVPRDRVQEAIKLILDNARYAGILVESDSGGRSLINLSSAGVDLFVKTVPAEGEAAVTEVTEVAKERPDWSGICFFITPIGDDGTDVRKHADMMLKHLIEPVAKEFDLQVIRADKIERSGLITQQIFEHIVRSRLCIADLSFSNPNAFYELAVRHMTKRAAIQVIRKGDRIPFDVSQGRTIIVDTSDVYTIMDRFESARRELKEHVRHAIATQADKPSEDNPVDVYLPGIKVSIPG